MRQKQTDLVLSYLREFGSITALEAIRDLGVFRLAARVYDLKAEGHEIETGEYVTTNRWGDETTIARYYLAQPIHTDPSQLEMFS